MTDIGDDVPGCLACDLTTGREPLPGGVIHSTTHWRVEHCIGPLGVGTLLVKPTRHVTSVAMLHPEEAAELGPVLALTADVVTQLTEPDQVYVCLWSHAGGVPGHIHFVAQPVSKATMASHDGLYGPALQMAMFTGDQPPEGDAVDALATKARAASELRTT